MPAQKPSRLFSLLRDNFAAEVIHQGLRGIERETLRVTPGGYLAQTPHPAGLGSALTNPYITTDYSESLLEFVTPPLTGNAAALTSLTDIHAFTVQQLTDELLWPASMPCILGDDDAIPIARYGASNVGMMKHIYRRGLGHRYGRKMQTIAGVHYNLSFAPGLWPALQNLEGDKSPLAEYRDRCYFGMIRNFQRVAWLIPLLFGASPAFCRSFLGGRATGFQMFDRHTCYAPYATSLRMSDIGYKNKSQSSLVIPYNNLDSYVHGLAEALATPDPEYAAIGTSVNGDWRQLSSNILQIENEYYSFIRPKQPIQTGERPTLALRRRGVQYLEVRALDIDPYSPNGVSEDALRFIELLLLNALCQDSPVISAEEQHAIDHNQTLVAHEGRKPGLLLKRNGNGEILLQDWAKALFDDLLPLAQWMDKGLVTGNNDLYQQTLSRQIAVLDDLNTSTSARMLDTMSANRQSYFEYTLELANQHAATLKNHALDSKRERHFKETAKQSVLEQKKIEVADKISFDEYLQRYYAQDGV